MVVQRNSSDAVTIGDLTVSTQESQDGGIDISAIMTAFNARVEKKRSDQSKRLTTESTKTEKKIQDLVNNLRERQEKDAEQLLEKYQARIQSLVGKKQLILEQLVLEISTFKAQQDEKREQILRALEKKAAKEQELKNDIHQVSRVILSNYVGQEQAETRLAPPKRKSEPIEQTFSTLAFSDAFDLDSSSPADAANDSSIHRGNGLDSLISGLDLQLNKCRKTQDYQQRTRLSR